ncbi:epoxide hydrolase [Planoprotostelium fungivorum]|uniref:Epoxide hydrolase n=1 Tax=Planoprotostelium fungivorum TaxID=1890364 RepID=A0A2P6NN74_9EUKA|nr:epoxide hydrolase [Planoprotostelium fungivorum]
MQIRHTCLVLLLVLIAFVWVDAVETIKPFRIEIPQDEVDEVKRRVSQTRLPAQLPNAGWEYGTNYEFLREIIQHWNTSYDWRSEESRLNRFPQYTTEIDGLTIHFIHSKSKSPSTSYPLLFSHGWPGTFLECTKLLHYLNEEENGLSFDVICPSLPGYGFSSPPTQKGFDVPKIASLFVKLMERLNYDRYIVQGGDWGSLVSTHVANLDREHCEGVHINLFMASMFDKGVIATTRGLIDFGLQGAGYLHIQATEPDTVAVGLNDSPAGLAAYLLSKYYRWSDLKGGDLEKIYTKDELLTFIHIYWFTQSIGSSMRLYYEEMQHLEFSKIAKDLYIQQPTGYIQFPAETMKHARWEVEYYYNLVQYSTPESGGHFAALEEPKTLNDDIRSFFEKARPMFKAETQREEL